MSLPVGSRITESKIPLRFEVPLSRYSTFQIGGPARYFSEPTSLEELELLLEFAQQEKLPFLAVGKGSNLLFPDEGYPGLVITFIHFEADYMLFNRQDHTVNVSSGVNLYRFSLGCREAGFGGAEFLSHIPGTIGGALVMNAGFSRVPGKKVEIGSLVEEVTVLTPEGEIRNLAPESLEFGYRRSNLEGFLVLRGRLKLFPRERQEIHSEIQANFEYRNKVQDVRYPSAGSVFKNPPGGVGTSGQLIEKVGLKGKRIGGAMISPRHANFIVNIGGAKAADVIRLMELTQATVLEAFNVRLEPEVRIIRTLVETSSS